MAYDIDTTFRDDKIKGDVHSGAHWPDKPEIRAMLKKLQDGGGKAITRNTLAALQARTPPDDDYMGVVLTGAGAGYYGRVAGAWVFGRGFPDTFGSVALSGDGKAQTGAVNAGVSPAAPEVFVAEVNTVNTGPLSLSIGGEAPRPVVNLAGNPLSPGEWVGVVMFFLNGAGQYNLMLDAGSAASSADSASSAGASSLVAKLEADRSEEAANVAGGFASALIIAENTFATISTTAAWSPVVAPDYIRVAGGAAVGDGKSGIFRNYGSTEPGQDQRFFLTLDDGVTVVWFGIVSPDAYLDKFSVGLGPDTLSSITTADHLTAVGHGALASVTSGSYNTAVGKNALHDNTSGNTSTAVGYEALGKQTTGGTNTGVGVQAGGSITTESGNTAVGYHAMPLTASDSNTAVGAFALEDNTAGGRNTAVGRGAMADNTTANDGTAVGYYALSANTEGGSNVAVGRTALAENTTGATNTALGTSALAANVGGSASTAVGFQSLQNNKASQNTAVGSEALKATTTGERNTVIGGAAMTNNTSGERNVAAGFGAGVENTTGTQNVLLGYFAGSGETGANANKTGSGNVYIGHLAGPGTPIQLNNAIAIGAQAEASASDTWVIGRHGTIQAIPEGSNSAMGLATLVAGVAIVSNTKVKTNSRIFLQRQSKGGVLGE